MADETPSLLTWRGQMSARQAVRKIVGAMARYLVSTGESGAGFVQDLD
ncbi:hypothetical protein [Bordetella sp. FB-8]|nr:hypothetical protein [Bordetella sp. FB-8]